MIEGKYGSSRPEEFFLKSALENFVKFTGEHFCWSIYLNKDAGLQFY